MTASIPYKGLLIVAIGIALVFLTGFNSNISHLIILTVLFGLITLIPFAFLKEQSILSGINIFLIYLFISYGVGAVTAYQLEERSIYLHTKESLETQLIFLILSSVCLILGYSMTTKVAATPFRISEQPFFSVRFLGLLAVLSIVGKFILFQTGNYYHSEKVYELNNAEGASITGFNQLANLLSWLSILGMMIGFYGWKRHCFPAGKLFFYFFFLTDLAYAAPTGSKEKLLLPLIFLILVYTYTKRFPIALTALASVFLFVVVFPFYNFYRSSENTLASVGASFSYFWENPLVTAQQMGAEDYFNQRLNYAEIQAVIIEKHTIEHKPYFNGNSYTEGVLALIPRMVWPDKPSLAGGNNFGQDYGFLWSGDTTTSVGKYLAGEAFMNFGWSGIFLFLVFGYFLGYIKKKFFQPKSVVAFFVYSFVIYQFVRYDQFSTFLGTIFFSLIFFISFFRVFAFLQKANE